MEKLQKPLLPFVTLDEANAFEVEKPETWTASPLVNAVLEAMTVVHPSTQRNVARYLDLDERGLSAALRIATGYTYLALRYHLILAKLEKLKGDHKYVITDEIARQLGFAGRSALSRFLLNQKTQNELKTEGPSRHAKPCLGRRWDA